MGFEELLKEVNVNNTTKEVVLRKEYCLWLNLTHGNNFRNNIMEVFYFDSKNVANHYGKLITEEYKKKYANDSPYATFSVHEHSISLLYKL